uniref:Uncharacterized protein n=1 Tax=Kalanchoe fedtschenkoi TaxID=63787 RepID=A0A7N0VHG7_KALFE
MHIISKYKQTPNKRHLQTAHHLLRYIKGAPKQGLLLPSHFILHLTAFYEANGWASCLVSYSQFFFWLLYSVGSNSCFVVHQEVANYLSLFS